MARTPNGTDSIPPSEYLLPIALRQDEYKMLLPYTKSSGGMQNLAKWMVAEIDNHPDTLAPSLYRMDLDLEHRERLIRYALAYGSGGPQDVFATILMRVLNRRLKDG